MNLHFNLTCLQRKKAAIHYGWTSSSQHNHREKTWSSVNKNQRPARNSKLPTQRQEIYLCKMIHIFFCLTLHAASLKKWMLGYLPLLYQYFFSTAFLKFEYLPSISNQDSKLTNWLNSSKVPIFSRWSLVVSLSFSVLGTSTKARADAYSAVSGCTIRWKPIASAPQGCARVWPHLQAYYKLCTPLSDTQFASLSFLGASTKLASALACTTHPHPNYKRACNLTNVKQSGSNISFLITPNM